MVSAEFALFRSIELLPSPTVVTNLGNLYRQMGRGEDALDCYERALDTEPAHLPARVKKGSSLLALSRLAEASALYTDTLPELPEHTNARIGLVQALVRDGNYRDATLHLEKVLSDDPDNAAALNSLGVIQKVLGRSEEAVSTLKHAALFAPATSEVRTNLASALALSGEEAEAISEYREALLLDPLYPDLHNWFNGYLSTLEHPDYLLSYAKALNLHQGAAPLAITYARKLLLGQQGEKALQVLKAVPIDGEQIRAYLACERSHILRETA